MKTETVVERGRGRFYFPFLELVVIAMILVPSYYLGPSSPYNRSATPDVEQKAQFDPCESARQMERCRREVEQIKKMKKKPKQRPKQK